jgi:hypothetical protein
VTETESLAIDSAVETLTGEESQSKEDIISGIFSGEGELQGVACKEMVFLIEPTALTKDVTPDSRLIEIAQVINRHLSGEDVIEGTTGEPGAGADTTTHGHAGSLLFVQESELDKEADPLPVGDVSPLNEAVSYEPEPEPENKPAEVTEPVSVFPSSPHNSVDTACNNQIQTSAPIDWSAEDEHELPPISGLQESFGGEAQPAPPVIDEQVPPEDDGFTTRSGRGRGGFRGEGRGGRGGYRGEGGRGYGRRGDRGGRGGE